MRAAASVQPGLGSDVRFVDRAEAARPEPSPRSPSELAQPAPVPLLAADLLDGVREPRAAPFGPERLAEVAAGPSPAPRPVGHW